MEPITITRGDEVLAHHTTETPLSHYGQPAWVVEDPDPAPGPATLEQGVKRLDLGVLGTLGGWLVCRHGQHGLLVGVIWSDGNYHADLIIRRDAEGTPAEHETLEDLASGGYMVRGTVTGWDEESPLGCVLPADPGVDGLATGEVTP